MTQSGTLEHGERTVLRRPRASWTDASGACSLDVDEVTVAGSAEGVGLCVRDRTVSHLHAELEPREDGLWVRDLGSLNGTYINEVRVTQGRVPPDGSLRLGSVAIRVSYDIAQLSVELWPGDRFGPLVGASIAMRRLFARMAKIATTTLSILIVGETGTGKELAAHAVHLASPRRDGPFVVVDCAALPENLVESELFGHVRGAFTGAEQPRAGAIESGDGGTVFLDEIGELPLAMQPKLLRAVESRQVRRVGDSQHRTVDVRFVSATHRDLREMVNRGAFREDLFFRLAALTVTLPPLRDRPEDVPLLARHLAPPGTPPFDAAVLAELGSRPWLGNVRELRNFVERFAALGTAEALATSAQPLGASAPTSLRGRYKGLREQWIETFERDYFRELIARNQGNVSAAAREAGVDRSYVHRMIRRYGL
jgi:two-component system, NtrC family, response regulator GlrR